METQGRKELAEAVGIAILSAAGIAVVNLACDVARDVWQDYRKRKKRKKKPQRKGE